ncbi:MAG: nucleoside triphosphate pyrophosphohydrolase [Ruminococcaceae bacterium]|nr:nucleoside triphosphate pyrophosphohydrolase [Oscillospiraceae bacterium]
MINFDRKNSYGFEDLCRIVEILRAPGGCPWDMIQTHESIRRNFLEEAYEVCEAIDEQDTDHLCEELGDVMLQVVFHAGIEKDAGMFTVDDVCDGVCKKLIRRHPHVFADVQVADADEVLDNWEEIKKQERGQKDNASVLDSVARSLPALWRADKLLKKAGGFGADCWQQLDRLQASASAQPDEKNVGDLLFAAVALARQGGVDPEDALNAACDRFIEEYRQREN